jgi:hypothetical protein
MLLFTTEIDTAILLDMVVPRGNSALWLTHRYLFTRYSCLLNTLDKPVSICRELGGELCPVWGTYLQNEMNVIFVIDSHHAGQLAQVGSDSHHAGQLAQVGSDSHHAGQLAQVGSDSHHAGQLAQVGGDPTFSFRILIILPDPSPEHCP